MSEVSDYSSALGKDFHEYIYFFPQLKCLDIFLDNVEAWLPLFENLPNLNDGFEVLDADKEDFEQRYLANKTKNEKKRLVERLAKVSEFRTDYHDHGFCPVGMKFVKKYFVG